MSKKRPFFPRDPDDPYVNLGCNLPRPIHAWLMLESAERELPASRLIAYALYNERQLKNPFHFDLTLPTNFVPDVYINEAGKLYRFLMRWKKGCSLDVCLLSLEEIGLQTKEELLHAYLQLKHSDIIDEVYPRNSVYPYGKDYRVIKVKGATNAELKEAQKRKKHEARERAKKYKALEPEKKGVLHDVTIATSDKKSKE